jgi:pimeloyl-ACP methyl ester carboxylesterase
MAFPDPLPRARIVSHRLRTLPASLVSARGRLVVQSILLLACLSVFALATIQLRAYERDVRRDTFSLGGSIPVPVLRFTPVSQPLNVVAVIAHGYSADKEMMSSFGVDLAKQGITTYAFDLPGHGASTVPYTTGGAKEVVPRLVTSVGEVVDYALAHGPAPGTQLVLIGYSLGTIAAGDYALEHPDLTALKATVLVAGVLTDRLTLTAPRGLLVLSGQFDLPGINDTAVHMMATACGVSFASVTDTYHCQGADPTAQRMRMVLPGLDHIGIVTANSTHSVLLSWLRQTVDPRIGAAPVNADARLHWLLVGVLAGGLALLPLLGLAATALGLAGGDVRRNRGSAKRFVTWRGWAALIGAQVLGLVVLRLWLPLDFFAPGPWPFGFLAQQVSVDVSAYFLVAGAALLAALRFVPALRGALAWPERRSALKQLLLAGGAFLFLYVTLGGLSGFAWESLKLSPERLWRAGVYTLMAWPFFLGLRAIVEATVRRFGRGWLADLSATLLVAAALIAAIILNFGRLSYLGILLPIVVIVLLAFIGIAAWSRRVVPRSLLLTSVMQSLVLGWLFAATLPLLA